MAASTYLLLSCILTTAVLDVCTSPVCAAGRPVPRDFATTRRRCAAGPRRTRRSADSDDVQYAVVIDAGSSGSRVRVYRWPDDRGQHVVMAGVRSVKPTLKIRIGLASVADNRTEVRNHIEQLIGNASGHVPPAQHADTPIYFMATAGT